MLKTLAKLCLLGAIPCLLGFPLAVIAYRLHWWPMGQSFDLIKITFFTGLLLVVLSMLIALIAMFKKDLEALKAAAVAFVLISIPSIGLSLQAIKGKSLPRIHDITTDTVNPPQFRAVLNLRGTDSNSLDYQAEQLATQQQAAYPYIQPIMTQMTPERALARAAAAVAQLGWELIAKDQATGTIEAVDTTLLWGFKDDIVIRVQATASGSRVDLRSVSRVGLSDLGANAARIRKFIEAFHQ